MNDALAPPSTPVDERPPHAWQIAPWNPTDVLPVEWCPPDPLTDPATIETPFAIIQCGSPGMAVRIRDLLNADACPPLSCASCGATNGACAGKISQGEGGCCESCDHRPAPPVPPTPAPEPGAIDLDLTDHVVVPLAVLESLAKIHDHGDDTDGFGCGDCKGDCACEAGEWLDEWEAGHHSALAAAAPSAPAEQPQPDLTELVEAVRAADAEYRRVCDARQNADTAYRAKDRARINLANAYLAASPGDGKPER